MMHAFASCLVIDLELCLDSTVIIVLVLCDLIIFGLMALTGVVNISLV